MPSKKDQQNLWSFYPSDPFKNGHFNVRHPVFAKNFVSWEGSGNLIGDNGFAGEKRGENAHQLDSLYIFWLIKYLVEIWREEELPNLRY